MAKLDTLCHVLSFVQAQGIGPKSNQKFVVNSGLKKWILCINHRVNHCDTCKLKGPAIGYCKNCKGFIDKPCYHYHQTINDWLNHEIVRFRNRPNVTFRISDFMPKFVCERHGKPSESYCVNCKVLVCQKCFKCHLKKNHGLNSIAHLCLLLEVVHFIKSIAKDFIEQIPKNSATESFKKYLFTIIHLVDVTLGIVADPSNIEELSLVQRTIETETGPSHRSYAKCEDVLGKLLLLIEDLLTNTTYVLSPETVIERQKIGDKIVENENFGEACARPPYRTTFLAPENIEDEGNSFSTTDSSIRLEQNPVVFGSLQSTEFGPYMMDHISLSSGDLFPSHIQEPTEETAEKQIEGEITILQTATQSVYFQDLHPVENPVQNRA